MRPTGLLLRSGRAISAALTCTLLAAGAHLSAGGRASVAALGAVLVGTWLIAVVLAGRRFTTSQLIGLLIIGQVVVHLVSAPTGGSTTDSTMLVAHVTGTAVSAWMLRHGEDALWTLADRIGLHPLAITRVVPVAPRNVAPVPVVSSRPLRRIMLAHAIEGRGPPVGFA